MPVTLASRNRANKRRGADYEIDLVKWFRDLGYKAERLVKRGSNDEGDVSVDLGDTVFVIEAKAVKEIDLATFVAESQAEAINYARVRGKAESNVIPLVVIKRRMKGIEKSYAVCEVETLLRIIGL